MKYRKDTMWMCHWGLTDNNNKMIGIKWFLVLGLAFLVYGAMAQDKPNILIILTDDQGYHDVSYYGTQDIRTPGIDQLCADGMRFDTFYANSSVCSPTRASLLSGRYPEMAGVPGVVRTHADDSWGYLRTDIDLLPEALGRAGYHTAIIGKWHLGLESPNTPNDRGFHFFHGFLGDMMDDYYTHRRFGNNYMRLNDATIDPAGHATDLFTEWAQDYIKTRQGKDDPFFLYLAYNAPHFPVQPPGEWVERVKQRAPGMDERRARLVAFIEHLDDGIGRVIRTLKETGQYDNTLIVFTSDNGGRLGDGANNGPLRDGKQSMYEGGLRVPTCVVWPGTVKAGSTCKEVCLTMDLYPTMCALAGVPADNTIDGVSLAGLLTGDATELPERTVFFHRREGGVRYGGLTIHAVRSGDWKLLKNSPYAPYELYNLYQDPKETNDQVKINPAKYMEMQALMRRQIQRAGSVPWQEDK
jgi:arylsulfatase A-like enzyme